MPRCPRPVGTVRRNRSSPAWAAGSRTSPPLRRPAGSASRWPRPGWAPPPGWPGRAGLPRPQGHIPVQHAEGMPSALPDLYRLRPSRPLVSFPPLHRKSLLCLFRPLPVKNILRSTLPAQLPPRSFAATVTAKYRMSSIAWSCSLHTWSRPPALVSQRYSPNSRMASPHPGQMTSRPVRSSSAVVRMPESTSFSARRTCQPPPPQALQKAGGGGVCHHLPDGPPVRQCLQRVGVFAVRLLPPLPAGVVIELLHPVPRLPHRPQSPIEVGFTVLCRRRYTTPPPAPSGGSHTISREKKSYTSPCRRGPFPQHEPAVEGPLEHGPVSLPHLGRQARVVLHGEVEVRTLRSPAFWTHS